MTRTITVAPHADPPLVLIVHTVIDYRSDQHARIWIHNRLPVHTTIHWGAQSLLHTHVPFPYRAEWSRVMAAQRENPQRFARDSAHW